MSDELGERRKRKGHYVAGAFGPSGRKQQVIDRGLAKVDAAAEHRDPAAYFAGQTPTPERITTALDLRMLEGPGVDAACGGEEPMVDEWETGQLAGLPELAGLHQGWVTVWGLG